MRKVRKIFLNNSDDVGEDYGIVKDVKIEITDRRKYIKIVSGYEISYWANSLGIEHMGIKTHRELRKEADRTFTVDLLLDYSKDFSAGFYHYNPHFVALDMIVGVRIKNNEQRKSLL